MLVLGISAAPTGSGWAVVDVDGVGARFIGAGRVRGSSGEVIATFAGMLTARPGPPSLVVVEDVRPSDRAHSQTVGRWLQAFAGLGVECATVAPGIWQASLAPGDLDRQSIGARSARGVFGVDHPEPDSVCVALWAGRKRAR